jgi:hypothetical protein
MFFRCADYRVWGKRGQFEPHHLITAAAGMLAFSSPTQIGPRERSADRQRVCAGEFDGGNSPAGRAAPDR